ncbi:uncharacterized protein LOC126733929 [Anthonomus grandis grandis]|uniref:uncharacterized protein LOC126733929 n=1 Tax=Anthonomus grandis grandis TaxID=2921223 RepID=UPI00216515BD|nr:uncharacterized protein LOC126733929 [Anthonomus grandis grandis]
MKAQVTVTAILFTLCQYKLVNTIRVKEIFTPSTDTKTAELELLENPEAELLTIIRVPRDVSNPEQPTKNPHDGVAVSRVARDSRYQTDKFATRRFKESEREDRSLKPEDHIEEERSTKSSTTGKRCSTCDNGYLGSSNYYNRGRDRYYDRYDRDPYQYSSRSRYDPYDRYSERDNKYYDRYDDYDRDYRDYRGRNRYSTGSYDRYDPRDRYYDRGVGYDNRGYDLRSRDTYSRYDPYDDYYSRGYDSYASKGYGSSRPDYYGTGGYYGGASTGYARGYSYGDRDRYGGYGNGYGSQYGTGSSRSRYPSTYDYDSGYRYTSYLYGRPSTTTDIPNKGSENDSANSNTMSPSQGTSGGGGRK